MKRVAAAAFLAVLAACTSGGAPPAAVPSSTPASTVSGAGLSAAAEMARLCPKLPPFPKRIRPSANVPAVVAKIEHEVESVRGLRFEHPVAVAAVSPAEMTARVEKVSAQTFPVGQGRRRTLAWETIGVLPHGSDLGTSVRRFLGTQVAGYYDSHAKELVYIGSANPTPAEQFVLAHELVHALDDQHFDLNRVDALAGACHDEAQEAATGAIEGSAVYFSSLVALRYFTAAQRRQVQRANAGPPPSGVPQFLVDMESWPYVDGRSFIASLAQRGGPTAVDDALRQLPTTTSEVMHPETYPSAPATVDVPELASKLGNGWHDLDVRLSGRKGTVLARAGFVG